MVKAWVSQFVFSLQPPRLILGRQKRIQRLWNDRGIRFQVIIGITRKQIFAEQYLKMLVGMIHHFKIGLN